jgi:hypothetical protein
VCEITESDCKVTKKKSYFPTFPHKKFFNTILSRISTKFSTAIQTNNQSLTTIIKKVVKSGAKIHQTSLFFILVSKEGYVNQLKGLKRTMYGRASIKLLEIKMYLTEIHCTKFE